MSELFGAVRGAYTGSSQVIVRVRFAAADGGTLFLDEIGELSHEQGRRSCCAYYKKRK